MFFFILRSRDFHDIVIKKLKSLSDPLSHIQKKRFNHLKVFVEPRSSEEISLILD